ncbi:MAG: hypothetical protein BGO51_19120 [Rhodospirillales bacterium 69-11]|nr:hypothetical protein [Rhodospirillales bacterium]MBN8927372.1 hypothetical protein [Rhodospirillales bacterium]OJW28593.1 MAG: hypothetical protein BGO51_19120 [Rhodospirillales bacterium 69-11]
MTQPPREPRAAPNVIVGMWRIARGRRDGLLQFGNTPQAFLGSLAPLIAFPLVGVVVMLLRGAGLSALAYFALTLCILLAPAAISFELARFWDRDALWLRFATAFNWGQWVVAIVLMLVLTVLSIAVGAGLSEHAAVAVLMLGLACYALWLHWFLARHALQLSPFRAALMVVAMNAATVLLGVGPRLLSAG